MSDDLKTRSRAWIKPVIFLAFFCVNVLAAYVPTPLFLREAATSTSPTTPKDVFFRVPVALAYIAVDTYMGPNPRVGFERFMQARRSCFRSAGGSSSLSCYSSSSYRQTGTIRRRLGLQCRASFSPTLCCRR